MYLPFYFLLLQPILGYYQILSTSISRYLPGVKLHRIILRNVGENMVEAVDFSPIDQQKVSTQLSLLLGKNVPAEIRVKQLPFYTGQLFIGNSDTCGNHRIINDTILLAAWSKAPYKPIYLGNEWSTMNLYTRNCQHFSRWYTYHHCK